MDQQQWKQINSIVDTALDLEKEKRKDYINKQCGEDPELKTQITKLLKSIEKSDTEDFLEGSESYPNNLIADLSNRSDNLQDKPALVGKTIHQYKITKLIGHGGMGSVFMAERADDAFKQKVALKILRYGMDTPTNIARFKRERHILAKLDHPNVARLLDGGLTNDGLPYLVMEYVEGTPLFSFCDKNQLSVKERFELFKSVCKAVQHAHNNAIIHRDLKPSNILVTEERQVKILDFGIAKLLEPKDPDTKLFETRTGARILTLGYAAPEQINNEHITTATDGYTLGLLLYELLAGVSPFEMKNLSDVEQYITEKTPAKPSVRFSALNPDQQNAIARNRKESAEKLIRILRGDLDAIIMKTLRKEPKSRYEAINQMVKDLERRELNHPIIAREDTFRYKASKFLKRYKTGLSTVTALIIIIATIIFYYSWQIMEERNRAQLEAEKAQQVSSFLTELFQASNPDHNPQKNTSAATLLERGKQRMNQLNNQPEIQAHLSGIIGKAYTELGQYEEAKPLIDRGLKRYKEIQEHSSPEYADALQRAGILQHRMGNYAKAESLHRKELNIRKSTSKSTPKEIAKNLNELGILLSHQESYQTADSLYKEALNLIESSKNHTKTHAAILTNRGKLLGEKENHDEAKKLHQRSLRLKKELFGTNHPQTATIYNDLALTLKYQGKLEQADSLYRKSLDIKEKVYDESHRTIATTIYNRGALNYEQENYNKAESLFTEALNMEQELLGKNHLTIAYTMEYLASTLRELGKLTKAEKISRKALSIRKDNFEDTNPDIAVNYNDLALIMQEQGKIKKADSLYHRSLKIKSKLYDEPRPGIAITLNNLANMYQQESRFKKAETYRIQALDKLKKLHEIPNPKITETVNKLAETYKETERTEKALTLLKEALEFEEQSFDESSRKLTHINIMLGKALIAAEDYSNSEILLTEGYQLLKEQNASQTHIEKAQNYLSELYKAWEKPNLADQYDPHTESSK